MSSKWKDQAIEKMGSKAPSETPVPASLLKASLCAPGGRGCVAWLCTMCWEAKASGPILLGWRVDCVLWHWWIRNSSQWLLEVDFLSGDLTSCFTSWGDQTVLGGSHELTLWKGFPFFLFLSFFNCMFQGNFWLGGLALSVWIPLGI